MSVARAVVITGASRGLGLVLTKVFTASHWAVVGTGRSEKPDDFPTTPSAKDYALHPKPLRP